MGKLSHPIYIYGLFDPTINSHPGWHRVKGRLIRYIGKSHNPKGRMSGHAADANRPDDHNHRIHWLRSLLEKGVEVQFVILEEITDQDWQERERIWIASFPKGQLTNSTAGGEGVVDLAPESRARIGAASAVRMLGNTLRRNTTLTQEEKDVISEGLLKSDKAAKAWADRKGKPSYERTEETKKKNAAANVGRERPDFSAWLIENNERFEDTKWITDGKENKRVPQIDLVPEGWRLGLTVEDHPQRGKPNPSWSVELKKQAKRRKNKMRWITDGRITKMWMPGDVIPEGWRFGKTFKAARNEDGTFVPKQ